MNTPYERAVMRLKEAERRRREVQNLLPAGCSSLDEAVKSYEAEIIKRALVLESGRIVSTAKLLGITYQGLRYLLDIRQKELAPLATPKQLRKPKEEVNA